MTIRIHGNNNLYYDTFIIWFVLECLSGTTIKSIAGISLSWINSTVNILVLLFLIIRIVFYQQYSRRQIVLIITITIPVIISAIASASLNILCLLIFVVAAKGLDINKLMKNMYCVLVAIIIFIIMLCMLGVIEDFTMYRGGVVRHSLGFSHPNVLGMRIFQFVICFLILHEGKLLLQMLIVSMAALFTYWIPYSQTTSILLLVLLLFLPIYYITKDNEKRSRLLAKVMLLGTVFFIVYSFLWTFIDVSKYQLFSTVNAFLSNRFKWTYMAFREYGIKLFGQVVYISAEERRTVGFRGHLYLDNAYATLLIRYGFVVSAIFLIMYIHTMQKQKMKSNLLIVFVYFIYSLYGIMESPMFKLGYNVILLYIAEILYSDNLNGKIDVLRGS